MNYKKMISITILLFVMTMSSFSFSNEILKVGYYDDYPLVFKDDNGEAAGFIIDILDKFNANNDYEIEYIYGSWSEMLNRLENGKIDLAVGIFKSEKRDEIYDFNKNPLLITWGKVSVNSKYKVKSLLDLDGLKVGYMDGDYYAVEEDGLINEARELDLSVEFVKYDTYEDIFKAIEKNEVNAGVTNNIAVNQIYDYKHIKTTPINFAANGIMFATKEGKNSKVLIELDDFIYNFSKNEKSAYNELYNFWFTDKLRNKYELFYYENKTEIVLSIFAIFLIIVFSRLQILYKTKELRRTNKELKKANKTIKNTSKEIKNNYNDLKLLINKFENLIYFINKNLVSSHKENEESFLKELMIEAFDLVKEADYVFAYGYDENGNLVIVDSINTEKIKFIDVNRKNIIKFDSDICIVKDFQNELIKHIDKESTKDEIIRKMDITKESFITVFRKEDSIVGGVLLEIKKDSNKSFTKESERLMYALKNIAESYLLNESYYKANQIFKNEMIYAMIQLLEIHDNYTKGHSEAVANYAKDLAKYIGMNDEKVNEIYWASIVHDIGKILIDKSILTKEDSLTFDEYEIMKKHPEFGYQALKDSKLTEKIAEYILYHHERIDGNGYPKGLKGDEIPIESKIIAIADSYDAMTSERTYKERISKKDALKEIKRNLNLQFDVELGLKFIDMMESR